MNTLLIRFATFSVLLASAILHPTALADELEAAQPQAYPPGWVPITPLTDEPEWRTVRDDRDHVRLYFPDGADGKAVRGVFVCFVFHSADPRELARHWNFAMVTVPWPFEYDLGHNDKRNGRHKLGHPPQGMGLLLRYLDDAAESTGHPELKTVPLVGWLGQNGSHLAGDLHQLAPERLLAWADSFPNRLRQYSDMTEKVPFAFAWEISKRELREGERQYRKDIGGHADLSCRANTYGFGHGIYSKFNFFMAYLDRCIQLRLPEQIPKPGEPVPLKPVVRADGWVGDFDPISEWNPILPAGSPETDSMRYPCWFPDLYAAWMWRSYHSAEPEIKLTGPKIEYRKKDGRWGGPDCGLGYGGYLDASATHTFTMKTAGEFERIEYHSGDKIVATASEAPWTATGVRIEPGLHALFAVGIRADGSRSASRPAFAIAR